MTRWNRTRRLLATLLLPLLAATLACNALAGPAGSAGAVLTQAAATVTAAANLAATQLAPPTSAPIPTKTAAAASTPTTAPSATALATAVASTTTLAPAATDTLTPEPGGAVVLDPCSLITAGEAELLTGAAVGKAKAQSGGCLLADAATGISSGVVVYALPASQSQAFFGQFVTQLKASGVQVDAAAAAKLTTDTAAGDMVAAVNDLIAISVGQAKYNAQKLDGVGGAALWSWNTFGKYQQGALIAAKPGAVVALILVAGTSAKETAAQPAMKQLVSRILAGLPANFKVAGLQVAGSAPVLDPCSLASASDIEAIMGAKATVGVAQAGNCVFQDTATHKLLLRVFALPGGTAAGIALNGAAALILLGNSAATAQVTADLAASDLVAAVRHLAASGHSSTGRTLESVDGLGDAAMFFAETAGGFRLGYLLAAKPGVLVGVDGLLAPGDDAATKTAAVAVVTRILSNLPTSFTVSGVP